MNLRIERARPLTTRPTVSVVIPCYNYGRFLPQAVASAVDQPGVDVEVLIVDDASTDGSDVVAHRLAEADGRVEVLAHERNAGHIRTYNDGLRRVRGDYVVLLSADDVLAPGALARAAALMESDPSVVLTYGYPMTFTEQPPADEVSRVTHWTVWEGEEWLRRICARGRNIIVNPEAMLRRTVMDELGGYEEDHPHAADMKLWMRAAARGRVGRVNGPVQAYYRTHTDNMHSTQFAGALTDLRESRRVFDSFFDEGDVTSALAEKLRGIAVQALAHEALRRAATTQAAAAGGGGTSADDFARFAVECEPAIRGSARWRTYQRRSRRGMPAAERVLVERSSSLRWALRWQRWRRWGT